MPAELHWLDEVDSTNRVARDDAYGHGDVIVTQNQTAGRGRMDRIWNMAPGEGLALTIVVSRLAIGSPVFVTRIPLLAAVELKRLLDPISESGARPTIKWPNDLHFGGRKVAGILVEALDDDRLAIGIGVNLAGVPAEIPGNLAIHLSGEGIALGAEEIATSLANAVLNRLVNLDSDPTLNDIEAAIDTVGRDVRIELPDGRSVRGRATALGVTGSMIVETSSGVEEFVAGDVTHLRHADGQAHSIG